MEMKELLPWIIVVLLTGWQIWKLGMKVKIPQELDKLIRNERVVSIVEDAILEAHELKSLKTDAERREYALSLIRDAISVELKRRLPDWLANLLLEFVYAQIRKSLK